MAKNISATALADGCIALLAIEDDGGPIVKEFVSAAVNANMTIHPSMTYGSGTWKGQLRSTWIHAVDGLDNHGVTFDAGNLPPNADFTGTGVTCVLILKALTTAALNRAEIWRINAANTTFKFATSDEFGFGQDAGGLWYQSTNPVPTATQIMLAGYWYSGGASNPKTGRLWTGLETDADMTLDKETTSAINAGQSDESFLGAMGVDGSGIVDAEVYYLAAFNGELDITKLNTIHDDPEAYFFEAAGSPALAPTDLEHGHILNTPGFSVNPTIIVPEITDANENPAASISGCILKCRDTTDDSVLTFNNLTTTVDGTLSISHPSAILGRLYDVVYEVPTLPNAIRGVRLITAI